MTPVILPILMSTGGGDPDSRERCKKCGQVLPKDRKFTKWLTNTFLGLTLSAIAFAAIFMFVLATVIPWDTGGQDWYSSDYDFPHFTLMQCIWHNLLYLVDVLRHRII